MNIINDLVSAVDPKWQQLGSYGLQALGLLSVIQGVRKVLGLASFWMLPGRTISYYRTPGAWALVTGSSAGIGFGCAQELAANGFSVVLLGHQAEELEEARKEILAECPSIQVKIVVIDCAKATAPEIARAVDSIGNIPVTVLINNVGGVIASPKPGIKPLREYTPEEIDTNINLNARFMTHMTRLMLPRLRSAGPALILNTSSGAQMGIPGVPVYSGTKGFITSLTKAVNRECAAEKMDISVVSIVSGEVRTQANQSTDTITAREFAKHVLSMCPKAAAAGRMEISPYYFHAFQIWLLDLMSESMRRNALVSSFEKKLEADSKKR